MKPAIRVDGLSKRYRLGAAPAGANLTENLRAAAGRLFGRRRADPAAGEFWALRDVSFEVQPGEVVGVIGRNGAGKSTLLKVLSRIVEPTGGRVELRGRVGSLLEVGTGFHPELTGRENVYLNGSVLGMTRVEVRRKFDDIVAFSGVEQFLDTPVKRYSSGMYVRLAFAVAAHLEPEILIVDEVLAVGDAAFQKKCLDKMGEVGRNGRTVLVVSHNATAIAALCQKGVLLRAGRVAEVGPVTQVLRSYLTDATGAESGRYDLVDHPARLPGLPCVIRAVVLRDATGRPAARFCSGEPLTVELHLEPPAPLRDARVAVAVEDALGRRLFTVATYLSTTQPFPVAGARVARCAIPELRLGTGDYLLSVSVAHRGDGLIDSVDGCGWFQVEAHNWYGTGESYQQVYGPILERATWTLV